MKFQNFFNLLLIISLTLSIVINGEKFISVEKTIRRILHQPLFPASSSPPPDPSSLAPPPPPDASGYDLDQPFFPEVPAGGSPYQNPPPPSLPAQSNGLSPIPTATQPTKPTKKVAIAVSVVIVTLGMLSALAFYLYKHRVKNPVETQKLVGGNSGGANNLRTYTEESRVPPSNFLYIGTVEPSNQRSLNHDDIANGSPYHKLNSDSNMVNNVPSVKRSDRYRPSPDLQPLPPLSRAPPRSVAVPQRITSPTATFSSSDDERSDTLFYTPHGSIHGSVGSADDGSWSKAIRSIGLGSKGESHAYNGGNSFPYSKRTSPRSWGLASSSPDVIKHAIIPSIKAAAPPPPPPPPPPPQPEMEANDIKQYHSQGKQEIMSKTHDINRTIKNNK